ncbi:MAG TPA: HEPN domain-containing protein [Nitrospirota bacterium]|nr:HEPN domain-containing protein [Nitrospirota bacterium]
MEYGKNTELESDLVRFKLVQARDSLDQARSLLAANMDMDLVGNSVFYAMYYAILALLLKRKVPPATQSVTLSLFDREFVQTGFFDWRFSEAMHRAFKLRKACSGEGRTAVDRKDIEDLLPVAEDFVRKAEEIISRI